MSGYIAAYIVLICLSAFFSASEMHQNRIVKLVCRALPAPGEGGGEK